MELHRQPLSITRGRIPARFVSIAHAKPVGPAPMQIRSYVLMKIVCLGKRRLFCNCVRPPSLEVQLDSFTSGLILL